MGTMTEWQDVGMSSEEKAQLKTIYDVVTRSAGFELLEQLNLGTGDSRNGTIYLQTEEEYLLVSVGHINGDGIRNTYDWLTSTDESVTIEKVFPQYVINKSGLAFYKVSGNAGASLAFHCGAAYYSTTIDRFRIKYNN